MQQTVNRFAGCKLITPLRPAVSVEYGAVLFGLTQASFASRIARFTYGIGTNEKLCPTNVKHSNPPNGALLTRPPTRHHAIPVAQPMSAALLLCAFSFSWQALRCTTASSS
jgi:hypothetical protein